MLFKIALFVSVIHCLSADNKCVPRSFGHSSTVCVCNSDSCHMLESIETLPTGNYVKYTTNQAGLRFVKEKGVLESKINNAENLIEIGTQTYQEIVGFGGAFTDATGINIRSLSEDLQDLILRSYFSEEGNEYRLGRVPIGGSDFSLNPYSYCDTKDNQTDPEFKNFKLANEDYEFKLPFIHTAKELSKNNLELIASLWIAPGWMKTDPEFTASYSFIKSDMYQVYADYYIKFLDAYKNENVSFWGITTGNEPMTAFMPKAIPSVGWFPESQGRWIKENFGPTLRNSEYKDIKIIGHDDSTLLVPLILELMFHDEDVKPYIDGIGLHWYWDFLVGQERVNETHNEYPDKFIIITEACNGYILQQVFLGEWEGAERYAGDIIENINNWASGWIDWNMALDMEGGPTFIKNYVDAPIIVNSAENEFYKQPSYYALSHVSKFAPKGTVRLQVTTDISGVGVTALMRPDGSVAVIILNTNFEEVETTIRDTAGDISLKLTPKSITSVVYSR
ncbi:lysosomal acid glucosylceramidase-like [Diabrotica undecimpunctata]|uniref:lysosomal acid glucosylceramidase-like n=1 Tax=Diabrotica undecimpunctata TaxID=50387 RepID=UPI003B63CDCC